MEHTCLIGTDVRMNDVDVPTLLMKPYAGTGNLTRQQQQYNYRQSRARMVVESAFGWLKGRWRCLLKRMGFLSVKSFTHVMASCLVLRNVLEINGDRCCPDWIDHVCLRCLSLYV